jgi:hypothetical protein
VALPPEVKILTTDSMSLARCFWSSAGHWAQLFYLSSSDNFTPAAGRRANKSVENPANVIMRPANVYKKVSPLNSMVCST